MAQKPFEDLTISDDFMFCKVMECEPICKEFLEMLFNAKIEKITYLSSQNTVTANPGAKTVRLDVLVKDGLGTSYDIEMCFPIDVRVYRKTRVLPFGKTSLLLETTAIHGGSETLLRKKLNCSAFFRTNHLNQGGFLGWNPKSPFFFWGL